MIKTIIVIYYQNFCSSILEISETSPEGRQGQIIFDFFPTVLTFALMVDKTAGALA